MADLPSAKSTDGLASRERCGVGQSARAGRETAGGGRGRQEASGAGREESGRHDDLSVKARGSVETGDMGGVVRQQDRGMEAWSGGGAVEPVS